MPSWFQDALFEAADSDIEEQVRDKHRLEEIAALRKFNACEPANASEHVGVTVLPTRFAHTS